MVNEQDAIAFVERNNQPFWKLYQGNKRIMDFDNDENPESDKEKALEAFMDEVGFRPPGEYEIKVFRYKNGDKGGNSFKFTKMGPSRQISTGSYRKANMTDEDLRAQVRREILIEQALERVEKKLDALAEFLDKQTDDDKGNDTMAREAFRTIFGLISKGIVSGGGSSPVKRVTDGVF